MKLLLDANISWRLVVKLQEHFTECFHVDHRVLPVPAKYTEIWNNALLNNQIIVTMMMTSSTLQTQKGFHPKLFY